MNKAPEVWTAFGDINIMEHGGGFWKLVGVSEFEILSWNPSEEEENYGSFHSMLVNTSDSWIDQEKISSFADLNGVNISDIDFTLACIAYYGEKNFGGSSHLELITMADGIKRFETITALDAKTP